MTHRVFIAIAVAIMLAACGPKPGGTEPRTGDTDPIATPDAGATAVETTPSPDATPAPDPKVELLAAEVAAYQAAAPVFDASCAHCHTDGGKKANKGKLDHFNMTTYPFGGHHTATITTTLRHVLGLDGAKPKMPKDKPGSVGGDGLALIAAWADAYDAAEQAGAHEGVSGYTPAE